MIDKIPLPGAKFTLYRDDGSIYADDIETTGTDGTVKVENIPWGSYYFLEKEAPEGCGLNDKKFKFVVNYLTAGKTQEITVEDPRESVQFTVTKKIKASDIVFEHGNPTFIFEAKNTENEHIYRKTVAFNEDNELKPDGEGYVTASAIFVVDTGTYEISEISVNRYDFEGITVTGLDTSKYTVSGEKVEIILSTGDETNVEISFKNKKTDQSGTSDNGMITNTLNRSRAMIGIAAEYVGKDIVTEDVIPKEDVDVYALYDNGTKELIPETDFTLSEVDTSKPNSIQEIKVTYDKDGKNFEDKISVQIGNIVLFKYEKLTDYAAGYSGSIAITGYIGHATVVDFPATLKVTEGGYEKTYRVLQVGNGDTLSGIDSVQTITFANGIQKIGDNAFKGCSSLQSDLTIPNSITSIGNNAFTDCTGLMSITFEDSTENPSKLTSIGYSAFQKCESLKGNLVIPNSVTNIGDRAFVWCSGLNGTLTLSNNLTEIKMNTFFDCPFTGTLEIPASVKKIGYGAFSNDDDTKRGKFEKLILNEGIEEISVPMVSQWGADNYENHGSFADCNNLKGELKIPNTVTTIGNGAFQNCSGFTDLTFAEPSQLKIIGNQSFRECTGFTGKLNIPETVEKIEAGAFLGDNFTGELNLPDSIKSFGDWAFENCSKFTSLKLPENVDFTYIPPALFKGCSGFTGTLTIPDSVKNISHNAFENCSNLTGDLIIPDSVTSIGSYAFGSCGFNGKIKVSKNIITIENHAFHYCNPNEIEIASPKLVTFGEWAFQKSTSSATSGYVVIPKNATVGKAIFYNCGDGPVVYCQNDTVIDTTWGLCVKTTKRYSDYANLKAQLGDELARQLGVDTW